MSHIDPESLALEALQGAVLNDLEREHLALCPPCRSDLTALARAVDAGRAGGADGLQGPRPQVWDAIVAEITTSTAEAAERVAPAAASSLEGEGAPEDTRLARHRAPRRGRRMRIAAVLTAAAAAVAIAVVVLIPRPVALATATLDPFPDHAGAHGSAELERDPDGSERVRVELDADVASDGFREVWLITEDGSALISLGVLEGSSGSFAVPGDVDTALFSVVDVSQEPTGGGAEHSGDSIVRGQLASS